jgi:quercetin dioxygenase-like cupin family protein
MRLRRRTGDGVGWLSGTRGDVYLRTLLPGKSLRLPEADVESAVAVLCGAVLPGAVMSARDGLGAGSCLFIPPRNRVELVASAPDTTTLLTVTGRARRPRGRPLAFRQAENAGEGASAVLEAGGGFVDMRVRWLLSTATVGSTDLVLATSTFTPEGHHELHRHPHAEEFFVVIEGGGEHLTTSGPVRLGPGDAVLVPPGEWHGYRTDPGVLTRTVYGYLGAGSLDDAGYEVRA